MTHGIRMDVKEPNPKRTELEPTWDIIIREYDDSTWGWGDHKDEVIKLMKERRDFGFMKHGTHLTPRNGRNDKNDALQELADFMAYTRNIMRNQAHHTFLYRKLMEIFNESVCMFETLVSMDMK